MINTCHPGCGKKWKKYNCSTVSALTIISQHVTDQQPPSLPNPLQELPRVPLITWTTEIFSSCPATFLSNCLSHLDQVQFNKQTDSSEWRWSVLPSLQGSSGWQDWKSEVDRGSELFLFGSQSHRSIGVGVQHSLKRPFLQGYREENQMLIHPLPALLALLPLCRLKIYTVSLSVSLLILNKGILDKFFIRHNLSKRYAVCHKRVSARSFHQF